MIIKNNFIDKLKNQTILEVLEAQIKAYEECFKDARSNVEKLDQALSKYYGTPTLFVEDSKIKN